MEHWWYAHGGTPAGYVIDQLPPSLREEVRFRVFKGTTINSRVFLPLWEQRKAKGGAGKGAKGPQKGPKGKRARPPCGQSSPAIRERVRCFEASHLAATRRAARTNC